MFPPGIGSGGNYCLALNYICDNLVGKTTLMLSPDLNLARLYSARFTKDNIYITKYGNSNQFGCNACEAKNAKQGAR